MSASEDAPQGVKTIADCFGHAVRLTDKHVANMPCACFTRTTQRQSWMANGCVWL